MNCERTLLPAFPSLCTIGESSQGHPQCCPLCLQGVVNRAPCARLWLCKANQSIQCDRVQAQRGRWSCIDGVTVFGWSGSALLGGYLVDRHGFAMVFLLTAALQLGSCVAFNGPLLGMVPIRECVCEEGGAQCETYGDAAAAVAAEKCEKCDRCGCVRAKDAQAGAAAAGMAAGAGPCCCCQLRQDSAHSGGAAGCPIRGSRSSHRTSIEEQVDMLAQSFDDEWGAVSQPLLRVDGRQSTAGSRTST